MTVATPDEISIKTNPKQLQYYISASKQQRKEKKETKTVCIVEIIGYLEVSSTTGVKESN